MCVGTFFQLTCTYVFLSTLTAKLSLRLVSQHFTLECKPVIKTAALFSVQKLLAYILYFQYTRVYAATPYACMYIHVCLFHYRYIHVVIQELFCKEYTKWSLSQTVFAWYVFCLAFYSEKAVHCAMKGSSVPIHTYTVVCQLAGCVGLACRQCQAMAGQLVHSFYPSIRTSDYTMYMYVYMCVLYCGVYSHVAQLSSHVYVCSLCMVHCMCMDGISSLS